MVKNAHFSRHFGENCKKTTRKRSFFSKLNNFLRILYVSFPYFYHFDWSEVFSAISEQIPQQNKPKKDIFKAKKLLFWQKLWKNDASVFGKKKFRRIFYAFFYVFTTLMGLKCLPLFLHKFHKMCRLWGKKPTFLAKTVKKRREKAVFFQIKNFLAHFLWFLLCFYHFEWSEVKKLSTRNAKKLSTHDPRT